MDFLERRQPLRSSEGKSGEGDESPKNKEENIEEQANYQGNDSLLLFERLSNPVIRGQIVELLYEAEKAEAGLPRQLVTRDAAGNFDLTKTEPYKPQSREEIERTFEENLAQIQTSTAIHYTKEGGDVDSIPIGLELHGKKVDAKYMSAVEAHEKGHRIRPYNSNFLDAYFSSGFDFDAMSLTAEEMLVYKRIHPTRTEAEISGLVKESLSTAVEIAERMSQLKNYFGFRGDEEFTSAHLAYARVHYFEDTGIDNGMRQFFQAITPKTESEFLRLINSSGI
jgi:hypothetical protein